MSLADRLAKAQQRDRISEVRARVQERLVESLGPRLYDATLSDTELEGLVHQRLRELLDDEEGPLSAQEKLLIVRQIGDSVLGLGPLEPFVRDPEVTEIMVNNWDTIYVERAGKLYWTGTKFHDDQQLLVRGERSFLFVEELAQALMHQAFELGVRHRGVVQTRPEGLDQPLLHTPANVGDPVLLLGFRQAICERHGDGLLRGFTSSSG